MLANCAWQTAHSSPLTHGVAADRGANVNGHGLVGDHLWLVQHDADYEVRACVGIALMCLSTRCSRLSLSSSLFLSLGCT